MVFPGGELRKLQNHFAVRAAAQQTEYASCKADSILRLMYLTAQPAQAGRWHWSRTDTLPAVEGCYLTLKHSLVVMVTSNETRFPG